MELEEVEDSLSSGLKAKQSSTKAGSMLRPVSDDTVDGRAGKRVKKRQIVSNEQG